MSNSVDDEFGVEEEYADELQERVEQQPTGAGRVSGQSLSGLKESEQRRVGQGIQLSAAAIEEIGRRAEKHSVAKYARSLVMDNLQSAADDETLFMALEDQGAEALVSGLAEWAVAEARGTVEALREAE